MATTKINYANISSGYAQAKNKDDVDERRWVHEKLEEEFEKEYKKLSITDADERSLKLAIDYEMSMHELRKQFDQPKPQAPKPHRSQTHQSVSLAAPQTQNPLNPQTQTQAAPKLVADATVGKSSTQILEFDSDTSGFQGKTWKTLKVGAVQTDKKKREFENTDPSNDVTVPANTELK